MKQKSGRDIKRAIANTFGSLGYLFCFLQWFWTVMLYFSVIQSMALFIVPKADQQTTQLPHFAFTPPTLLQTIVMVTITIFMVAITAYVLVRVPIKIVKTGNKIVHKTTEAVLPIAMKTQHKKDTKKNRAKLTPLLVLLAKALLIIVPVALTAASGLLEKQSIDYSIAMIIGGGLAGLSILFFALQYLLARLFRTRLADLR